MGFERFFAAAFVALLIAYALTQDLNKSLMAAGVFAVAVALVDPRGAFMDLRHPFSAVRDDYSNFPISFGEHFDNDKNGKKDKKDELVSIEEPEDMDTVAKTETFPQDNVKLDDTELDQLLAEDEKNNKQENEESFEEDEEKEAEMESPEGGLDMLKSLIDKAKVDLKNPPTFEKMREYKRRSSPAANMKQNDINYNNLSSAQAQRETHRLMDSVKQLKETLNSMGPTLRAGKRIMDMYKQITPEQDLPSS
jgi:hypothetical protein